MNAKVPEDPRATIVRFEGEQLVIELEDGRTLGVPLQWFSSLANASVAQRENWRLIGKGVGLHWPDLDEDISIAGLLARPPAKRDRSSESRGRLQHDLGDDESYVDGSDKSVEEGA